MRVLLAEDNSDTRELLVIALESKGWEVFPAKDGREALTIYEKAIEDHRYFDALILDVAMPHINGIAVGVEVRSREKSGEIPRAVHIYLTGYEIPTKPEDLLRIHFADAYLRKPVELDELFAKIEELVEKAR